MWGFFMLILLLIKKSGIQICKPDFFYAKYRFLFRRLVADPI
jgi:hypothetical protein